jgi:hypothetical protein
VADETNGELGPVVRTVTLGRGGRAVRVRELSVAEMLALSPAISKLPNAEQVPALAAACTEDEAGNKVFADGAAVLAAGWSKCGDLLGVVSEVNGLDLAAAGKKSPPPPSST